MKTLITGSTGFIGKRLCIFLDLNKISIIGVSRKKQYSIQDSIICDLKKEEIEEESLVGVDTVYHLAGYAHDLRNPEELKDEYYLTNVLATINLAKTSARMGVKDFIFVSSVKAGLSDIYDGSSVEKPEGIYGETKREAELELIEISKETDMKISIIRPSLVYGPSLKGNLASMKEAIKAGWFPPIPKLNNKRSMIHVDDLVKAIVLVKQRGLNSEIYTATDGTQYSTTDIYENFCSILDKNPSRIRIPLYLFKILALFSGTLRHKVNKLIGDEYYSSIKLESLGFKAELGFEDLNETLF